MDLNSRHTSSSTLDLSGLPEPLVDDLRRLVGTLRSRVSVLPTPQSTQRPAVVGLYACLGLPTPPLDEFANFRRAAWEDFPRLLPTEGE
jgi:hypothetical protein